MKTTDFFMKIEIESIDPNTQQKITISITPHVVMEAGDDYVEARNKVYEDGLQFIQKKIEALKPSKVEQKQVPVIDNPPLPPLTPIEALNAKLTESDYEAIRAFEKVLGDMDLEWIENPIIEKKPLERAVNHIIDETPAIKKQSSFSKYVK
jgi:hypothetical protein